MILLIHQSKQPNLKSTDLNSTTPNPTEQSDKAKVADPSYKAQTSTHTNTTAPPELVQHQEGQAHLEQQ